MLITYPVLKKTNNDSYSLIKSWINTRQIYLCIFRVDQFSCLGKYLLDKVKNVKTTLSNLKIRAMCSDGAVIVSCFVRFLLWLSCNLLLRQFIPSFIHLSVSTHQPNSRTQHNISVWVDLEIFLVSWRKHRSGLEK